MWCDIFVSLATCTYGAHIIVVINDKYSRKDLNANHIDIMLSFRQGGLLLLMERDKMQKHLPLSNPLFADEYILRN